MEQAYVVSRKQSDNILNQEQLQDKARTQEILDSQLNMWKLYNFTV